MTGPTTAEHDVRRSAPAGDLDRGAKLPLIAVVAIHGVADQPPFESARQVANLLLGQRYDGGEAAYSSFREFPVRLPVDRAIHASERAPSEAPLDVIFTNELLADYRSDRTAYDTVRLEGHRLRPPQPDDAASWIERDQCHVHVYEMYWADLSRLGTGLVGIAGATYQLIASLAGLGMRTLRQVQPDQRPGVSSGVWKTYLGAHLASVKCLTLVVPFLNLALLALALSVPIAAVPSRVMAWSLGGIVLVALIAGAMRLWLRRPPNQGWRGPVAGALASLAPAVAGLVVWALLGVRKGWTLRAGLLMWTVLAFFALLSLSRAHRSRHEGVSWIASPVAVGVALLLLLLALMADSRVEAASLSIRFIEVTFYALSLSWLVVMGGAALSGVLALAVRRDRAGVRQAGWTAATTLALSTASVSAIAMLVWSVVFALTEHTLPRSIAADSSDVRQVAAVSAMRDSALAAGIGRGIGDQGGPPLVAASDSSYLHSPLIDHLVVDTATAALCFDRRGIEVMMPGSAHPRLCAAFTQRSMPRYLMSLASASGLLLSIATLLLVAFAGIMLAGPGVVRELWPRHDSPKARARSVPLGTWLTLGFEIFRWATMIAYALLFGGTLIVIGLGIWLRLAPEEAPLALASLRVLRPIADTLLFSAIGPLTGSAVAASTVGLLVLLSRFESVARVVRPALDVILDVDNYLRNRPRRRTPRARIAERFVSLLRYLAHWRREGKGYDRVIVVSHSQGTVIAAELLRYHRSRQFRDLPLLSPHDGPLRASPSHLPPIDLVTMGSPLRQLYGRSFPDLFAWTQGHPNNAAMSPSGSAPGTVSGLGPSCKDLGVHSWTNLFRSGDYVGRALWQDEAAEETYRIEAGATNWYLPKHDRRCRERCLGEGAHTHYWDVNAGDVAAEIDDLIEQAHRTVTPIEHRAT